MENNSEKVSQRITRIPSSKEIEFMNSVAIPILDKTEDEKSLKDLNETFWNLCLWEKGRADILDTKASYLLGLSSIAAAVVAVGGIAQAILLKQVLWAAGVALGLFTITTIASLIALLGKKYGSFNDIDVFESLQAYKGPIGDNIKAFVDVDPRRCFLRETILQRWLIYRWYGEANNSKFIRLIVAQVLAVLSVLSLMVYLILVLYKYTNTI